MMHFLGLLLILFSSVRAFHVHQYPIAGVRNNLKWRVSHCNMAIADRDTPTDTSSGPVEDPLASISIEEVLSPPRVDWRSIMLVLAGQGLLLGGTTILSDFLGAYRFSIYLLPEFDPESMKFALTVAIPLIFGGLFVDRLPVKFFQDIARDTRVFTLRILGRASNPLVAAFVALLISMAAAYSEEICFRGFLFNSLTQSFGDMNAALVSSALFGLLHAPLFGASTLVEASLGAAFCYSYVASGYNIAVPIAVHTMYDFFTLFLTWLIATKDLKTRVLQAEEQMTTALPYAATLPEEFDVIATARILL